MSKRPRTDNTPPASASADAPDTNLSGDELLAELAAWCDKELRDVSDMHVDKVQSIDCENSELDSFGDESFNEFLEDMKQDQRVTVEEHKKGEVATAWRHALADATRLNAFVRNWEGGMFGRVFHNWSPAMNAVKAIWEASTDAVDEWYFDLGYELASRILSAGAKQSDSDDESDEEPVEEDDSGEEDDEEEESDESGSDASDSD